MPRQPSIIAMIQNRTIMVRNGSWRPHLADGEAVDTGHLAGDQNRDAHRAGPPARC
jgi:hypothetical protein